MPPDEPPVVPLRSRQGWSPTARLQAGNQLRTRLTRCTSVVEVAETGAEFFRELLTASTVTISTYEDGRYKDVVNAGYLPRGEEKYPGEDCYYPETMYPASTERLHERGGYYTSDQADPIFEEYLASTPTGDATSILGVSIVSGGRIIGEVFATRSGRQSALDGQDFELTRDLGTTLGTYLRMAQRRERQR